MNVTLESMWQDWCTEVSVADFFVIAAEALIEATLPPTQRAPFGSAFEKQFRFGRASKSNCTLAPCQIQSMLAMQLRRTSSRTLG